MKIKFNWGTGIVVAFIIMIAGMVFLVSIAVRQNEDLVEKDYYQKSLNYEKHMDEVKNTGKLASGIKFERSADSLILVFPDVAPVVSYSGSIHFYSPVSEKNDLSLPVKLNSLNSQIIDLKKISKGRYTIKIDWTDGNLKYYQEDDITVGE